ncbi:MAG: cyclic nucleotide-binding domain-containing protein [Anaerolineales bacterium]|nr:cyclic nucleotide-binding domain-containing protein [Anaerolineales bacterium]
MSRVNMFKYETNVMTVDPGTVIFEAGDAPDFMYVVQGGEVEIKVGEQVIEVIKAGGIFGEMALVDPEPRTASAVARTECTLVPLNEAQFTRHIHATPFFALQVMRIITARLRKWMQSAPAPTA